MMSKIYFIIACIYTIDTLDIAIVIYADLGPVVVLGVHEASEAGGRGPAGGEHGVQPLACVDI